MIDVMSLRRFDPVEAQATEEESLMSRMPQKPASRGSQKWIQLLVNRAPHLLDRAIARHLSFSPTDKIAWLSPLAQDAYAEYRDEMFAWIQTGAGSEGRASDHHCC